MFRAHGVEEAPDSAVSRGLTPAPSGVASVARRAETIARVDAQTRDASGASVVPERWCWIATGLLIAVGAIFGGWAHDHGPKAVTFNSPRRSQCPCAFLRHCARNRTTAGTLHAMGQREKNGGAPCGPCCQEEVCESAPGGGARRTDKRNGAQYAERRDGT